MPGLGPAREIALLARRGNSLDRVQHTVCVIKRHNEVAASINAQPVRPNLLASKIRMIGRGRFC